MISQSHQRRRRIIIATVVTTLRFITLFVVRIKFDGDGGEKKIKKKPGTYYFNIRLPSV